MVRFFLPNKSVSFAESLITCWCLILDAQNLYPFYRANRDASNGHIICHGLFKYKGIKRFKPVMVFGLFITL
jgi:hypothetical protein